MNTPKMPSLLACLCLAAALPTTAHAVCGQYYNRSYSYPGYDPTWTVSDCAEAYSRA